jgi:hypothetical protein
MKYGTLPPIAGSSGAIDCAAIATAATANARQAASAFIVIRYAGGRLFSVFILFAVCAVVVAGQTGPSSRIWRTMTEMKREL